jgi:hypothetical protein
VGHLFSEVQTIESIDYATIFISGRVMAIIMHPITYYMTRGDSHGDESYLQIAANENICEVCCGTSCPCKLPMLNFADAL